MNLSSAPPNRFSLPLAVAGALCVAAVPAHSQQPENISAILERLDRLEREVEERDARIDELEASIEQLEAQGAGPEIDDARPVDATPGAQKPDEMVAADDSQGSRITPMGIERPAYFGEFQNGGLGFKVADTQYGDLSIGAYLYTRYTNQKGIDQFYTDAFGRTFEVDRREDLQVNKTVIMTQGWVGVPNLRYLAYVWTSNSNLGNPGQVVAAGNLTWIFDEAFNLGAGVNGLPSTRSMEGNFPDWLRVDTRLLADEFFRASFTTGIYAFGELGNGFRYKAMLGNNLSQLGVDAVELGGSLDTFSTALIWNPMGDYHNGFGDFENNPKLVTRFAAHYTHSTEDRQSQPGEEDLENTQLRLSDGTVLFEPGAFGTAGRINEARYQMVAVDAGVKYGGWSLEGEYYVRRLDNFVTEGLIPVTEVNDHGFQMQASAMLLPEKLQAYIGGSKVYGDYGDPWDVVIGTNYFPFNSRQFRLNAELIQVERSPIGNNTLPYVVGANGTIFHANVELSF